MNSAKGRDLHGKAEMAREGEQDLLKSLTLTDEATIAYAEDGDQLGLAEVQGTRFNAFKHLYQKTGNKNYLILAKHAAMSAVEIAEKSGISEALALPYRDLAKAHLELEEYQEAIVFFEKALNAKLPEHHNRPGVVAEIKAHLAYAKYKTGDKSALGLMTEAISELENSDEFKYNKDVWLSGAHMRTADMLKEDNLELAKDHLQKAKEIIDANPELKLRAEQWEKLAKTI